MACLLGFVRQSPRSPLTADAHARSAAASRSRRGFQIAPRRMAAANAAAGARARVRAAYEAKLAAGQTPTGVGLARAAGVSERYGQRLPAEFTPTPTRGGHPNGGRLAAGGQSDGHTLDRAEGR